MLSGCEHPSDKHPQVYTYTHILICEVMFIKTPRWKKKSIFAYGLCIAGVNKQDCKLNLACLANKVLLEHSHAPSFAIAGCILQCQSSYHRNHMA